jgi:pyridoxamine 5'-phosphate oxidase
MKSTTEDIPDPSQMRVNYNLGHIFEKDMSKDPLDEFKHWFKLASECKSITEPNTMILCTSSKSGLPSGRPLLVKVIQ